MEKVLIIQCIDAVCWASERASSM